MSLFPKDLRDYGGLLGDGQVFAVDPTSGSDSNVGTKRSKAFASLSKAFSECTDDRGDVIIRYPGSETPSAAISMNKAGVTVVSNAALAALAGLGYGMNVQQAEKFATYPAAAYATGPMAIITKPVRLIGLEFVTRVTAHAGAVDCSDAGAAIAFDGDDGGYAGGFSELRWCRFVDWWGTPYGLFFRGGAYNRVLECVFEGFNAGVCFGSGTRNPDYNHVIKSHFVDCVNGIEHYAAATPHNFLYRENTFVDYTDAIDFNNQAADGLVCGNWFETATDAATYDITVAQAQAHGVQFSENHYSE